MAKVRLNVVKWEQLRTQSSRDKNSKKSKIESTIQTLKKVGSAADKLLDYISSSGDKIDKSARLIRELIRIFNN